MHKLEKIKCTKCGAILEELQKCKCPPPDTIWFLRDPQMITARDKSKVRLLATKDTLFYKKGDWVSLEGNF